MKAKWLPLSAAVALAFASVSASAVDFHGYARSGIQTSTNGGEVYCLDTGTSGHRVGRLGDECDTYAEFQFDQTIYNKGGNKFELKSRLGWGSKQENNRDYQGNDWQIVSDGNDNPWNGQRVALNELWVNYNTDAGYSIWAGKRYYQRKDIHLLDLYYINNSGSGFGVENIDVGLGNLNFAITKWSQGSGATSDGDSVYEGTYTTEEACKNAINGKDNFICKKVEEEYEAYQIINTKTEDKYRRHVYKLDLRWNGIPLGPVGSLDIAVLYAMPFVSEKQQTDDKYADITRKNNGVFITLDHSYNLTTDSVSLMNHFIAQYATNGFAGDVGQFGNHAGANYHTGTDLEGVRLIDWGTLDIGNFGLGYSLLWAHLDSSNNSGWARGYSGWEYSMVVRPEYKWTDFTRTTLELGYSQKKDNANGDPDAYKFTLAQQFTPGKSFWSRPAIRFYVSYLGGDQFASIYKDKNKDGDEYQITFGSQMEAWW